MQVLPYGLEHSVTPKRIPTEAIVSSVEAVLSRQRELSEPTKDNIRSRIASTMQSSSLTENNLTKDERQALKGLKNDDDIVILPADKGRVTVVMDKKDYHDKMDTLYWLTINRLTKYLNETRRRHFNENSTANYFNLRKRTLLTYNVTTD